MAEKSAKQLAAEAIETYVKIVHESIEAAEKLADEHGLEFEMSFGRLDRYYGNGERLTGTYEGAALRDPDDFDLEEGEKIEGAWHWDASSLNC